MLGDQRARERLPVSIEAITHGSNGINTKNSATLQFAKQGGTRA